MAPKKKGGKKQADDWENELGETPDPIAAATEQAKTTEAQHDDGQHAEVNGEELEGGGLLAALKKNKAKRAKKGKPVQDFVEGEDPTAPEPAPAEVDLAAKAPEEATLDDEDAFAGPSKKGKGGKSRGTSCGGDWREEEEGFSTHCSPSEATRASSETTRRTGPTRSRGKSCRRRATEAGGRGGKEEGRSSSSKEGKGEREEGTVE